MKVMMVTNRGVGSVSVVMKRENWWPDGEEKEAKREGYSIFSTTDMKQSKSPRTQTYLVRVYANLAVTTATTALAILLYINEWLPDMGALGLIVSIILTAGIPLSRGYLSDRIRLGMLWMDGFMLGWNAGPLTQMVFDLEADLLLTAVVGSFAAFVSFSGAALFSQRRSFLYLGAMLSVTSLILLASSFFPSLFNVNLYLGLFMFCFYIIYDTQILVERAEMSASSDPNGVDGTLQLFTDLYAIFVRLLIILMKDRKPAAKRRKPSSKQ